MGTNEILIGAIKNIDTPKEAVRLLREAKRILARTPGNISKVFATTKVFATRTEALALEIEHGKVSKEMIVDDILKLANEVKMKNM